MLRKSIESSRWARQLRRVSPETYRRAILLAQQDQMLLYFVPINTLSGDLNWRLVANDKEGPIVFEEGQNKDELISFAQSMKWPIRCEHCQAEATHFQYTFFGQTECLCYSHAAEEHQDAI